MGGYSGPKVRLSRSLGVAIAETPKHVNPKRDKRPGIHGYRRVRRSLYGTQLTEKQRIGRYYNIRDGQVQRYVREAQMAKRSTTQVLQQLLETRLDNVVRRVHWARTIWQGRQMVSHGHFLVNGRKVNVPSFNVMAGDVISVKPRSENFVKQTAAAAEDMGFRVPDWLSLDEGKLKARVLYLPQLNDVLLPFDVDFSSVIEFYTR